MIISKGVGSHESKTSASHDEVMVKRLRKDRAFAAEYLKAAMEDTEETAPS